MFCQKLISKYIKRNQISLDETAIVLKGPTGELVFQDTQEQVDFSKRFLKKYMILMELSKIQGGTEEYWLLGDDGKKRFRLRDIKTQIGIVWIIPRENQARWVRYIKDLEKKENSSSDEKNRYYCVESVLPANQNDQLKFWVLNTKGERSFEILLVHNTQDTVAVDRWTTPPDHRREAFGHMGVKGRALGTLMRDIQKFETRIREEIEECLEDTNEGYEDLCKETIGKVIDLVMETYLKKNATAQKVF